LERGLAILGIKIEKDSEAWREKSGVGVAIGETLDWALGSAPFFKRTKAMASFPEEYAEWKKVSPSYRERS
jgi:hypothetical protein